MADILTYVLHYEGQLNKNSLGAVSEGAARAQEIGGECHAVVVGGDDLTDELCQSVGAYGATNVFRAKGPKGLRSRWSTRWPRSSTSTATRTHCSAAACSVSRSAPAWPRASTPGSP